MANENKSTEETPIPGEETPKTGAPVKGENAKQSGFEKALADEVAAIKKFVGFDGKSTPEPTDPPEIPAPDSKEAEHDSEDCYCPACYFKRGEE